MPADLPLFFGTLVLFVLYLFWSAATEMGTSWPKGRRKSSGKEASRESDGRENQR
jgi:hypothetical protein